MPKSNAPNYTLSLQYIPLVEKMQPTLLFSTRSDSSGKL